MSTPLATGTRVNIFSESTNSWHDGRTGVSEVPGLVTISFVCDGLLAAKHLELVGKT